MPRDANENPLTARLLLRALGLLDLLALLAVVAPREVIAKLNALCGLETLPDAPLVGYLARSGSLLYALHGAMVLFISFDIPRYRPFIRFMAWAAILHGCIMLGIDFAEQMPFWWRVTEGPAFAATGILVLWTLPSSQNITQP